MSDEVASPSRRRSTGRDPFSAAPNAEFACFFSVISFINEH